MTLDDPVIGAPGAPDPLLELGVRGAAAAVAEGRTTAASLLEAVLARIDATDGTLAAWVTVDGEGARAEARQRDEMVGRGRVAGPLHGVPIGIKDIIDVAGMPTLAGAAAFAHTRPGVDATLVARLRAAGAVIVGKTVATQFAYKDPAATRNPWSDAHTPGGSSSGSAAAVAARHVPAAIGTQTVGSILRPAAFCGVVGLKGAHGAIPLDGVVPLSWSLDHAGPIARSVGDAALLEAVMLGSPLAPAPMRRPRLGWSAALLDRAGPELRGHLDATIGNLASAGAEIVELELPAGLSEVLEAGVIVLEAEAAAVHELWFERHAADYAPEIGGLVRRGLARTAAEVADAQRVRAAWREAVLPFLEGLDALLSPVAPGAAPPRAEGTGDFALCAPWSFTGVPSIAIPTGLGPGGLPFALQLSGAPNGLERLLGAAAWCEAVIAFDARPPGPAMAGRPGSGSAISPP